MVGMRGALPPRLFMVAVVTIFLNDSRQYLTGMERVGMEEFDEIWIFLCIQGVSGGIVNISEGGSMDYSE